MAGPCAGLFRQKDMKKIVPVLLAIIMAASLAAASDKAFFYYPHTKGEKCGREWLLMEKLLSKNGLRCEEVIPIAGFPYLRGNRAVLSLAPKISTKYAAHKWLELLRRIDLEARYAELSALPRRDLEKFCSDAHIRCYQGRIRAYVARCSAIIMGDEKSNHDFMKVLKRKVKKYTVNAKASGSARCFEDDQTLDGIAGQDVLLAIFAQPHSNGMSARYLEKRIMSQHENKPY